MQTAGVEYPEAHDCFNGFGDRVGMVTEAGVCLNLVPKRYIWPNTGVNQVGYDMGDFQDILNDYFTGEQDRLCRVVLNPSDITQDVYDTSNGNGVFDERTDSQNGIIWTQENKGKTKAT